MSPRYIVSEQFLDIGRGELVRSEVKRFTDEDSAIDFFNDNNDRDNLVLTYRHPDGHTRTWNSKYEEWDPC